MRKLIVQLDTGFMGQISYEALVVPESTLDYEIDNIAWTMVLEHAESYGHDAYDDELMLEYSWWDYQGEDDDNLRAGGGSFEEDFVALEEYYSD